MKRFQVGEFDGINFSKAVKKSPEVKFVKVDEDFEAGTSAGNAGDYVIVENNSFKVVSAADFEANYTVTEEAKKEKKAVKAESAPVKKEKAEKKKEKVVKKSKK